MSIPRERVGSSYSEWDALATLPVGQDRARITRLSRFRLGPWGWVMLRTSARPLLIIGGACSRAEQPPDDERPVSSSTRHPTWAGPVGVTLCHVGAYYG